MMKIFIILILMVSVPSVMAQNYTELMCENPDEKGFCFKAITSTKLSDAGILLIVLVGSIAVTVVIIFGKNIARSIRKH